MSGKRVERRLAAILAADAAGYSRLIGEDEEGTLAAIRAIRREVFDPELAEHGGRVVKTTGDGMLVEFQSVVEALRCASAVQAEMAARNTGLAPDRRIDFRVGIHQGDIVVEDDDIFGDGVNVAARLEALAEPGGICVSARVQEDAAGKLDLAFEDIGEQELKNIARPVRVYRIHLDPFARPPMVPPGSLVLPDKPSVAVLPFANMSSDPEQEYFADGMVEEIITALSRYPSLFVIARNSCFTYKGRAIEVRRVGRELGVRYVVEGSLRKAGSRIRVTAQLVEAETGNHIWAERYDRDLADIFAVQDEITDAVTIAIAPAIADAERRRAMRKPPDSLDAWAAYQRGRWHYSKISRAEILLAESLFQRAIDLDPNFAGGYRGLAAAQHAGARLFQTRSLSEAGAAAESLARRAAALDGADAEARASLGMFLVARGDYDGGRLEADRALAISPNLPLAHQALGHALIFGGRPEEGLVSLDKSVRLDPQDPEMWLVLNWKTVGLYFTGEYAAASELAKRLLRSFPDYPTPHRWLAAALGQLGRTEEAKEALHQAIALAPASFDLHVRGRVPWMRPEDHAHMVDGLRKAGWEG